ncbi:hypothetical protein Sru01_52920 [Sphaerisporangium rufum]|uniref:Uncharacterized protein n=1 Tax=Sphaerisporangium rufum TaxID=1381558 RepID=A0A919V7E9_9ACTN|nr:hypothetical protein Sru01_52920 [Sphaerisporangium rufum]
MKAILTRSIAITVSAYRPGPGAPAGPPTKPIQIRIRLHDRAGGRYRGLSPKSHKHHGPDRSPTEVDVPLHFALLIAGAVFFVICLMLGVFQRH